MNSNNLNPNPNLTRRVSASDKRKLSWLWLLASLAVALLLALNPALSALAAPGDLDPTFGTAGKVTTDFFGHADGASAVAVQSDGKIVAAGFSDLSGNFDNDFALSRYNSDGTLDISFDADGKVTTPILSGIDQANAVAIQSDGKIVAAGAAYHGTTLSYDFALARYNSNGSLDNSFDADGKVVTDFLSGSDGAFALAIQSDGKIVAVGYATDPSLSRNYFALARYNSNGSLDTTFGGGDGLVTTDFGNNAYGYGMAIQSNGKIVVAGYLYLGAGNEDFALARYNADGSLDHTFSGDGLVTTDFFGSYDTAYTLAIQTDGKIVAAGYAYHGTNSNDFALARYLSDGNLDTTFSGNGKVFTDFGSDDDAFAIAIQSNGKIVAGGRTGTSAAQDFALARFTPNGSLDSTFSGDGKVTTDFSGGYDEARAMAIQGDGKIVAAGYGGNDFALARYDGDTSAPPTQTPGGPTATPIPTTCPIQFTDVAPGSTFYSYVRCLACRNIVGGYSTTPPCTTGVPCFLPANNVTRGQMAKFVSGAANYQDVIPPNQQTFTDVPPNSTFWLYVERAYLHNVISGYTTTPPCTTGTPCFLPGNDVTRGQTAKFVSIGANYQENIPPNQQTFTDVTPNSTFWVFIERVVLHGVVSGYSTSPPCTTGTPCFLPSNNVTRGQTAKFISNAFFPNCQTP